jgi:DNA polymerase I-like protein with 3'-5' exonuclease and polymerase domains
MTDQPVFIYFDGAQAEARIVAYRANIPKWKDQFERARKDGLYDAHRALASEMFKLPYDEIPKADFLDKNGLPEKDQKCDHASLRPTKRYIAKRCRHGLNYRMERFRLAEVTGLPYHEAARAFSLYHNTTPELKKWWEQEEKEFKRTKEVFNALGRRLKIIQRLDDEALESLIAFYPQSTLGDKIVQVWYQAEEDDRWPDPMYARVCLNVHDNLVGLAMPKYAKTCLKILKSYAESPILISDAWHRKPEPLIIPAETKMSFPTIAAVDKKTGRLMFREDPNGLHRWSHMKEVKV